MKKLILIFIFISGINLFGQTFFYLRIYNGEANYLKGYNQYLPDNYYIFNYKLYIVGNKYHYDYEKEYIYNYTNKKMYLLKDYYDYYYYDSSYNLKRGTEEKFYDLNGKRRDDGYSFAKRTVEGTNRYGEEIAKVEYIKYDYDFYNFWSIQSYKNSFKLPNVINPKNIGLYDLGAYYQNRGLLDKKYDLGAYYQNRGLLDKKMVYLALASEYQRYHAIIDGPSFSLVASGYDYSGKDYIFGTNIYNYNREDTNYYIIDLETKSKINYKNVISKEEYEKELNKETKEMKSQISEKEKNIDKLKSELSNNMQNSAYWENQKDYWIKNKITVYTKKPYKKKKDEATAMATAEWEEKASSYQAYTDNLKKEIEKLENEIKELEKSIEELENIYKNRKNSELENKYIKIFREKLPELEDKYYYFGENSITTNSINFIPFKYLKPYFEESVKTKEQFYKFINFENEK